MRSTTAFLICLMISVILGKPLGSNEGNSEQPPVPAMAPDAIVDLLETSATSETELSSSTVGSPEQLLLTAETSDEQTLGDSTDGQTTYTADYLTTSIESDQSPSAATSGSVSDALNDIAAQSSTPTTSITTSEDRPDNLNVMFDSPNQVTPGCPTGTTPESVSRRYLCPWTYRRIEIAFAPNQTIELMEVQCVDVAQYDCATVYETIPVVTASGQLTLRRIAVACTPLAPQVQTITSD